MTTTPLLAAIEQHRHQLWSICYRMAGSTSEPMTLSGGHRPRDRRRAERDVYAKRWPPGPGVAPIRPAMGSMFAALPHEAQPGAEHAIRKQRAVYLVLDPLPDPAFEQRK